MRPKVSVIVPVYNAEKYLAKCLDSILASDLQPIEIITIDDGSIDSSARILEKYRQEHGITVLSQQNGGASKARNKGLEVAIGEYVGFVDSDDWIEPNMYSSMYDAAVKEKADIVFCNIYRNENEKRKKYMSSGVYRGGEIQDIIYPQLISVCGETIGKTTLRGATWPRIFRRELLEKWEIRYDEELVYNEDGLFSIQATLVSERYIYLGDSYLYHNRYVPESLTKRYIPDLWKRQKKMVEKLKDVVRVTNYDFCPQIDKKTMEIAIYCAENECKRNSGLTKQEVCEHIKEIICSKTLQDALCRIDPTKLKKINVGYWCAMRMKSVRLVQWIARYRHNKHTKA